MPRNMQWLLLVAAFLIVLILMFVLLSGGSEKKSVESTTDTESELFIDPSEVDWSNIEIGTSQTQKITITASVETKITSVKLSKEIDGLSFSSTCANMGRISDKISCVITLIWQPKSEIIGTGTEVQIMYHAANAPAQMAALENVPVLLSTKAVPVFAPAPVPTPVPVPVPEPLPIQQPDPYEQIAAMSQQEIDALLADTPSLAAQTKPAPVIEPVQSLSLSADDVPAESCYEFAFPGYGLSGQQIGWIRPYRGGYRFHPFSDTSCNAPTGNYNPDTGMITDLNDAGKKIGTDAERIGYRLTGNLAVPNLSNPVRPRIVNRATQLADITMRPTPGANSSAGGGATGGSRIVFTAPKAASDLIPSSYDGKEAIVSSENPFDRKFVLRQYKPIPATIVSEIRADPKNMSKLPVVATVDRNVYSDNGRTIILPAGTQMLGYVTGELPGPYKAIGRMQIQWYRFVRPDGVEFSFNGDDSEPFSGDAQGRVGVPGYGSTDYMEQFIMPMITAIVPAAVNMIAPISDKFVNQIDLDNNTVVQSGNIRSSELAKNEIITAWNRVAQRLAVDMLDNTTPPFSIAAGTRITVYSPKDLIVNFCGKGISGAEECTLEVSPYARSRESDAKADYLDSSWVGQVRSLELQMEGICGTDGSVLADQQTLADKNIDYRTAVAWCQTNQYQAKSNAQWDAYYKQQSTGAGSLTNTVGPVGSAEYNNQVLGMQTNSDTGLFVNPFAKETPPAAPVITCEDGLVPDANGCCLGEVYTDMGEQGFNCCSTTSEDCFPPIL